MKWFHILVFLTLFVVHPAKAESSHDELVHLTAHAGASFAITMVSDQIYNKFLGWSPGSSLLGGLATALIVGSVYKLVETGRPASMADGIIYNTIGSVEAIGTIFVFDLNVL
jgi:hypothetical protein